MTTQSELALENSLVAQLVEMKYEKVSIRHEADLVANLKAQLEKHNNLKLTDKEFDRVLNHLNKGGVYDRAKILRDKMSLLRDDGTRKNIELLNQKQWCQNEFQVARQVEMEGAYKNRYDVTILINGLPLAQIELKRRGLELKEAFNQTNRYHRHSYNAGYGLFQYIQIFVISNGVNTKYYANNRNASFKFTSFWADKDNNKITKLSEFTKEFLEKCHLAKMIAHYTVLRQDKTIVVLRPYQYYAVEAIVEKVQKNHNKNGYIWHTTGSGKTLTSFKASQILTDNPDVHKVVFCVDRNDLDTQTIREFNEFKAGSVDQTDNTKMLVSQFGDPDSKLIVTTIQKLNNAISREHHKKEMDKLRDKKIVFIFDECHRSQFGETHKKIVEYFTSHQLFGFTGTPIFKDNASGSTGYKRTTKDLFGECLHKYVITDAINDENVLKFSVEYVGKYKEKQGSCNDIDIDVEGIDVPELMESREKRLEPIVDYIIANHNRKTHDKEFTAMFAVSNINVLTDYYDIFETRKKEGKNDLRVATIFTYSPNEDDKDANGLLDTDIQLDIFSGMNKHSRDKLEGYIADYNKMFGTNFTTKDSKSFYSYYRDIAQKIKDREKLDLPENRIDILLVVNMFLTGFDAKKVNTLYVDKNLRYHGLIQAYSRTNRILSDRKSQGNIVVFRNLRSATNKALELFANKDAQETIFIQPYEDYLKMFNETLVELQKSAKTPADVDALKSEEAQLQFVKEFRELIRVKNILASFVDFDFAHTNMSAQDFEDYKSKYLDIYDKVRSDTEKEKVSILEDVDFELELIARDEINVDYILKLLARIVDADDEQKARISKNIFDVMGTDPELRSKRELIQKFIDSTIPDIKAPEKVENAFKVFWEQEKLEAFKQMCKDEGIKPEKMQQLINDYLYTGLKPRNQQLVSTLQTEPRILERESIIKKVKSKLDKFLETFVEGI